MTTADLGARLAFLERQIGARKPGEIVNLESRIDHVERLIDQYCLHLGQYQQETASKSAVLQRRIRGLERLVIFLADVLIALIAVLFAGLVAGYLGGDYWLSSSSLAVLALLVAYLGANTLFRKVTRSLSE